MRLSVLAAFAVALPSLAFAGPACPGFGPQAPRDISLRIGANPVAFAPAPAASEMNLCNIHFHAQAEHRGPEFRVLSGEGEHQGYACDAAADLTPQELEDPSGGHGACHDVKPGDTIEVHWVHSSCDVAPGESLAACSSAACTNPELRVEAQVFLVVNDPAAADLRSFDYRGAVPGALNQARALPPAEGAVQFLGSTTGAAFAEGSCSPFQVTWNVRPSCMRVNVESVHAWCADNASKENHAHGVRRLVQAPELLSPIVRP